MEKQQKKTIILLNLALLIFNDNNPGLFSPYHL